MMCLKNHVNVRNVATYMANRGHTVLKIILGKLKMAYYLCGASGVRIATAMRQTRAMSNQRCGNMTNYDRLRASLDSNDPLDIVNAFNETNSLKEQPLSGYWLNRLCAFAEIIVEKRKKRKGR